MPEAASAPSVPSRGIAYFRVLVDFFRRWVRTDINTLTASLAVIGALKTGLASVFGLLMDLRRYLGHFLTSSVTINGSDKLNREVINWLGAHVLERKQTRSLLAQSNSNTAAPLWYMAVRDDRPSHQQIAIKYLPTFDINYFRFEGTLIMVQRHSKVAISLSSLFFDRSTDAPTGREPLLITCISRSVDPIKKFLDECKQFAKSNTEDHVMIQTNTHAIGWDTQVLRSPRPLETIHFDEQFKDDLIADITHYLKPETRDFYHKRGIPYRRGYLLHGPPGTGKSSLSFAIAGHFSLELMVVDLSSIENDRELVALFAELPAQCIVLIEDIDAVGLKRKSADSANSGGNSNSGGNKKKEEKEKKKTMEVSEAQTAGKKSDCTLSGLLNVLDGVVAQQGRIVLMMTNREAGLDEALTRPGRIDKKIYLGLIGAAAARQMFVRMYASDHTEARPTALAELLALADRFGAAPALDRKATPAQVQEYLLQHRDSPQGAVEGLRVWVDEETRLREEKKMKEAAEKAAGEEERGEGGGRKEAGWRTTGESEKTDDTAAAKDDDRNDSSNNSSDIGEVVVLSSEGSNGDQSDSSDSRDSKVESEKKG
ncbi:Mitochondrial chaperone BCS1 [Apiospora phragmitis]|uniref:Mitochondrial chaperone BCS1 n=1 Tax=Apiospora phragmitis TaxID=2905665 RepID=A0ABR1V3U3_9PEZI